MSEFTRRPAAGPLRVCLVVPYDLAPEAGGVKQHAVHLMAGLRRLGDSVTLIGPASQALTMPHTHGFGGIVPIRGNGSVNRMGLLCSPWALRRFFAQHTFDVVHMHEPEVPALTYWTALMQRRVAQVATFHAYAERPPAHVRLSRKLVGSLLYRNVQRGIAVSPGAAQLAQGSFGRPLHVIPNGVDHRLFCPEGPTVAATEGGAPRAAQPFRLLFVGGPGHPRKGARYLLEALQPLWAQGACVILDVVGAADDATTQRLRQLPHVRHHQDVSTHKLAALYRSCDALVAPATGQESFGIILLEAMATAKPIIATDIEGYRRVLDSGHEPGALLVPPKDAPALRGAIARLMAMPAAERAAMGAQNHRNVAPFTWDTVTQKLRALYLGAMAEAQASS